MNCDWKMMLKIAAVIGVALGAAYLAVPGAHAWILASAPILVALICPVAMVAMLFAMNRGKKDEHPKPDAGPAADRDADARKA
jgi:hypothetical protein